MAADTLQELSQFVSELEWDAVPAAVQERTRVRLLDAVGCGIAAREHPVAVKALAVARDDPAGPASHWLSGTTGSAEACAFGNSILAHALIHEDIGRGGHPGSNVVPAAVAVAESEGRSGADLLVAIAAGYEVQVRLGAGDLLHTMGDRGLRGTTAAGCFGAAAATARLLRLSPEQTRAALAFAASLCVSGIEQPLLVGSDERCLQVAANTRSGIQCALLARAGYVGATSALSGEAGFFAVYGGLSGEREEVVAGLGYEWRSDELVFKPYPTAGWNVGPIYSTLSIVAEHGVVADEVERVDVLHTWWHRNHAYVFAGPFTTIEQALISCNFALGCALVYGRYDWEAVKEGFEDPHVADLARRVHVDGVATWGFTDGAVTVVTRDGRRLSASAAGIPDELVRPNWAQVVEKFQTLSGFLPVERRVAIVEAVELADTRSDLEAFSRALRATA